MVVLNAIANELARIQGDGQNKKSPETDILTQFTEVLRFKNSSEVFVKSVLDIVSLVAFSANLLLYEVQLWPSVKKSKIK